MADRLIVKIDGDTKPLENSLSGIEKVGKVGMAALKTGIAAATTALVAGGTVAFNYNRQMEDYMASFTTMLGDEVSAVKHIEDLKKMAAKTPFEMTDLAEASKLMLSFGADVSEIEPSLKMLGDISLGNSEKFKGLALVFSQVKSQGKLMGQDLLQMINQGFNPLQIISEKTGKTMAELKDEMSQGKITFEDVAGAMQTATSEGGKFYNAMDTASTTTNGLISTLKDNVKTKLGEAFQNVSTIIKEKVLPAALEFVNKFDTKKAIEKIKSLWTTFKNLVPYIAGATSAMITFKAALAITTMITKFSKAMNVAQKQLALYAVGQSVATTTTKLSEHAITRKAIVAGVLTGQLKLATAAQYLWNSSMLSNPFVLVTALVAALVTGIAALILIQGEEKTESEKLIDTANKRIKSLQEEEKEYDNLKKSSEEQARANVAETSDLQLLQEQLLKYVDANGKVKEGQEERATLILGKLNEAMGTEYKLIDGQIQKYDELKNAIDETIKKQEAQIWLDSYKEAYSDAIKKATNATKEQTKATKDYTKAKKNLDAANKSWDETYKKYSEEIITYDEMVAESNKYNFEVLEKAVKETDLALDIATENVNKYANDIAMYQSAQRASLEGDNQKVIDILSNGVDAYTEAKNKKIKTLEEQLDAEKKNNADLLIEYDNYYKEFGKSTDEYHVKHLADLSNKIGESKGLINRLTQEISDETVKSYENIGKNMIGGLAAGLKSEYPSLAKEVEAVANGAIHTMRNVMQVKSPSRVFRQIGQYMDEGLILGVKDDSQNVNKSVSDMAKSAISAMKNIGPRIKDTFNAVSYSMTPQLAFAGAANGVNRTETVKTINNNTVNETVVSFKGDLLDVIEVKQHERGKKL